MENISLPNLPKGREFEEYVSALFQSSGDYYVERNIVERDVEEVLELDVLLTYYKSHLHLPKIKLLEVKSGSWGFSDLFKIRGWMDYLNISDGMFVVRQEKDNIEFYKEKMKRLNIHIEVLSNSNEFKEEIRDLIDGKEVEDIDVSAWRYSYWVERNLLKRLKEWKKTSPNKSCYKTLEEYYSTINDRIFFFECVAQKVMELYEVFKKHPRISAKCANELIGNGFSGEYVPQEIYEDAYCKYEYNVIQISTFIEHRARLAILKNAVDYKLYKKAGIESKTNLVSKVPELDSEKLTQSLLPPTFKEAVEDISKHKYFHRYPIFWQWFMWLFGGFILKDYEEKEYEILSQKTGIPVNEIPKALESYQILFPINDGWFMDLSSRSNSNVKVLKMFPVPFMGIGAYYRKLLYARSEKFEDLQLKGEHTLDDLIKWNKLTSDVLNQK